MLCTATASTQPYFFDCSNIRGRISKDPSPIQPIFNGFSGWTSSAAMEAGRKQTAKDR